MFVFLEQLEDYFDWFVYFEKPFDILGGDLLLLMGMF